MVIMMMIVVEAVVVSGSLVQVARACCMEVQNTEGRQERESEGRHG